MEKLMTTEVPAQFPEVATRGHLLAHVERIGEAAPAKEPQL
jgi:hypothetical protein